MLFAFLRSHRFRTARISTYDKQGLAMVAGQRILVVDDNDDSLNYLRLLLSNRGYEVVAARNGAEALQSALTHPPELIVSDILMPVMDGFTLCRIWRGEPRLAGIPFAFCTATYTDAKDRELALSAGADEFLVKPVQPEIVLEKVESLLRQKEAGTLPDRSTAAPEMNVFLREYNAALVRKLEDKLLQLEAANQKLADAEEFAKAVLDNSPLPIMVADITGKVVLINPAFSTIFGYAASEATGRYAGELINPRDVEWESALMGMLGSGDQVHSYCSTRSRKDGSRIDVEVYLAPVKLRSQVTGLFAIYRDVTEHKRLEEQLRHSQKMEALGRLAGSIAHDFNNLLMLISGYLGRLVESELSPEQRATCEEAIAGSQRATALTRQLLTFSRKKQEVITVTDLNTVISNMHAMLRSLVSDSLRLDVVLASHPLPVLADLSQLEVVIMNLAINAQDAMTDGGLLTLQTSREEQDSGTFVVLMVGDTGRGMTPEVQAHIFEPFFTTKETGKGTGLGLSIVHGIVKRCGGHIEVESEPGRGTQFRVYLPQSATAPTATAGTTPGPLVGGRETILLAEDEAGIRAMTKAYLAGLGYKVLEAADGLEAVKISCDYTGDIDLVLADVIMPGLRGHAAVRLIRERRPSVKVLYISGYAEDATTQDVGAVLYKPFEFPELGRKVRSVLDSNETS